MRRFAIFTITLLLSVIEPIVITFFVVVGTAALQVSGIPTNAAIWLSVSLLGVPLAVAGLISIKGIRNKITD